MTEIEVQWHIHPPKHRWQRWSGSMSVRVLANEDHTFWRMREIQRAWSRDQLERKLAWEEGKLRRRYRGEFDPETIFRG